MEGAIETINETRDAMNAVQLHLDEAGRTLRRSETHTEAEVAKLEHEHAPNLLLVEAYEEQKLVSPRRYLVITLTARRGLRGAEAGHLRR